MAKTVLYPSFANPPQGFSGPIQQSAQWRQPWSEPVRSKIAPRLAIALIASGLFAPVPVPTSSPAIIVETASSEVIFSRSFIYQSQTWVPVVTTASTAIVVPTNWGSPPPQRKRVLYQSKAYAPVTPAAAPVISYSPWSEPVRTKRFGPHLQDVGAPDVIAPPPVASSQWYQPWTDPTRRKGISVALHQNLIWSNFTPAATPTTTASAITFTDGVVFQRSFIYQAQTRPVFPPTAVITEDKWHQPWSEPTRQKKSATNAVSVLSPQPLAVLLSQWYEPWIDPPRPKRGALAAQQQFLAWSTFTPAATPQAIAVDAFTDGVVFPRSFIYQASTKPVFVQTTPTIPTFFNLTQGDTGPIFRKSFIYQVNTDPISVTAPFSYLPWSEPTRRTGFPVRLQQTLAWPTFTPAPPVVIFESMWHQPWSGPVRFRRFNAALQSSTSLITPPQPNFIRTISWYQPYSEPVRKKKGIGAWLQQVFGIDTKPPPQPPIPLVMSVTEINSDTFLGAIRTVNPAAYVRVSIKEIQVPGAGLTSIEET